jgi:hypothetical protein
MRRSFQGKNIIPEDLSRSELLIFRKKAKHYKMEKGVLHFIPSHRPGEKHKKVLRTQEERTTAINEALGDGQQSQNEVLSTLRKKYFWPNS